MTHHQAGTPSKLIQKKPFSVDDTAFYKKFNEHISKQDPDAPTIQQQFKPISKVKTFDKMFMSMSQ